MNCEHCGHNFDSKQLDAQQGSSVSCPKCEKSTKVQYTVQDEIKDPVGAFVVRDTKYANPVLVTIGLIVLGPVILIVAGAMLIQKDAPEARFLAVFIILAFILTVVQFIKRMTR